VLVRAEILWIECMADEGVIAPNSSRNRRSLEAGLTVWCSVQGVTSLTRFVH
jgi:hypothetical protein